MARLPDVDGLTRYAATIPWAEEPRAVGTSMAGRATCAGGRPEHQIIQVSDERCRGLALVRGGSCRSAMGCGWVFAVSRSLPVSAFAPFVRRVTGATKATERRL